MVFQSKEILLRFMETNAYPCMWDIFKNGVIQKVLVSQYSYRGVKSDLWVFKHTSFPGAVLTEHTMEARDFPVSEM